MQKILLILGLFATSLAANGQSAITLTKTNITGQVPGPFLYYIVHAAGVVAPKTGANQAWDYTVLTGGSLQSHSLVAASTFSNSAVVDPTTYDLTVLPGAEVHAQTVYDIDDNGYFIAGAMIPAQNYS